MSPSVCDYVQRRASHMQQREHQCRPQALVARRPRGRPEVPPTSPTHAMAPAIPESANLPALLLSLRAQQVRAARHHSCRGPLPMEGVRLARTEPKTRSDLQAPYGRDRLTTGTSRTCHHRVRPPAFSAVAVLSDHLLDLGAVAIRPVTGAGIRPKRSRGQGATTC
jgi:hypothetical protein